MKLANFARIVFVTTCIGAQCNVDPQPTPEPDPSGITIEQACANVVSLGCATEFDCVSALQDISAASVDPELQCILEAKTCMQVESCN